MTIKLAIMGAAGRMGRETIAQAINDQSLCVVGACEHPDSQSIGLNIEGYGVTITSDISSAIANADVIIDFSLANGVAEHVAIATEYHTPFVTGVTGMSTETLKALEAAGDHIPVLRAANFSIGMNLLLEVSQQLSKMLPNNFDIDIIEAHHNKKKDTPSGTALSLASAIGRDNINIHAIRSGDIIGDHTIMFSGDGERLELKHQVQNRATFARGALTAAKYVATSSPGMYSMSDIIKGCIYA